LRHEDLNGIGRGAEDDANVEAVAHPAEQVGRIRLADQQNEDVSCGNGLRVGDGGCAQFVIRMSWG
jgi:hypothetical protein